MHRSQRLLHPIVVGIDPKIMSVQPFIDGYSRIYKSTFWGFRDVFDPMELGIYSAEEDSRHANAILKNF